MSNVEVFKNTPNSKIHEINGRKVMLDRDVAEALGVKTGELNENAARSPKWDYLRAEGMEKDYRFQLKDHDMERLLSQNAISSSSRHLPYVYTRSGCAYFGTSMDNPRACAQAVQLVEVFEKVQTVLEASQEHPLVRITRDFVEQERRTRVLELEAMRLEIEVGQAKKEAAQAVAIAQTNEDVIDRLITHRHGGDKTPPGTLQVAMIRKRYFFGVSETNISEYLKAVGHQKVPYTFVLQDGVDTQSYCFGEEGLTQRYLNLIDDSVYVNTTPQRFMFSHDLISKPFMLKKSELSPYIRAIIDDKIANS